MERCGFFDANLVGGEYDRVYLASQFAAYFASFIGNGVFAKHSNQLQVVEMATPQMQIGVERGQAWINGYWYENTDILYLPIDVADGVLNRIDSVVLRLGFAERNIWLTVKKGTPAINPIAPEVTRNADYYELQLATISIPAGSIKITQAQITDTRMNNDVCGWVTGIIDQVDTTTLFNQYMSWYTTTTGQAEIDIEAIKQQFQDDLMQFEQDWNNWFSQQQTEGFVMAAEKGQPDGVATLDENGKIPYEQIPPIEMPVTSVNGKTGDVVLTADDVGAATKQYVDSKTLTFNATLNTSWSGSNPPYSKSVTVTGILSTDNPIIDVVMSGTYATDEARQEAWGYVYRAVTGNNSITFYATEKPTVNLPIQIKVVR